MGSFFCTKFNIKKPFGCFYFMCIYLFKVVLKKKKKPTLSDIDLGRNLIGLNMCCRRIECVAEADRRP